MKLSEYLSINSYNLDSHELFIRNEIISEIYLDNNVLHTIKGLECSGIIDELTFINNPIEYIPNIDKCVQIKSIGLDINEYYCESNSDDLGTIEYLKEMNRRYKLSKILA